MFVFLFKQKTSYEMRISDWSSDVCSSDLGDGLVERAVVDEVVVLAPFVAVGGAEPLGAGEAVGLGIGHAGHAALGVGRDPRQLAVDVALPRLAGIVEHLVVHGDRIAARSEEHTSELQSLMRSSYAVFFFTKKNIIQ